MDDAAILEAIRDAEPATTGAVAAALGVDPETIRERLAALETTGRIERENEEWGLTRDPKIDESIKRITDRLDRERL